MWGSACEPGLIRNIQKCGDECVVFAEKMADYHADGVFSERLIRLIHSERVEAVVSYDYFPLLSIICDINHLPYAAWIYDCPQYTLYSKTIGNEWNYLFCFDKWLASYLEALGARHVYPMALGSDVEGFRSVLEQEKGSDGRYNGGKEIHGRKAFQGDISFVGSLYEKYAGRLWEKGISGYCRGYLEGVIEAQKRVYGYNMIGEVLPEALCEEIVDKLDLRLSKMYYQDSRQMAADAVNYEISYRERMQVLALLGKKHRIMLYSVSPLTEEFKSLKIEKREYVDYETQMPLVFRYSKINLNITSKTIPSGIPQRVFDIMACGGFCMTNYQPEIAEAFTDGEDIVMYESMEDMLKKAAYYLEHDDERMRISQAGYRKVCREFSLDGRWRQIRELIT